MKKIITFLLLALLLTTQVNAEKIYENKTQETLTKGVVLESTDTYTDSGWQRIDVVKIDLTDQDIEVKVLSPENGVSERKTVKQLAEQYGTKAAINGDFFNMISGETNTLGMAISDGELLSTPSKDNFSSFALTEENHPIFDYFTFTGTLYAENTSLVEFSSCELYQINKVPITTGGITMLTSAWGKDVDIPIGNYAMAAELVGDGKYKTTAFSWGGEPVAIPEGGAVFTANYNVNGFLNMNFATGDIIRVDVTMSPDIENIKESIGGNTLIVKDGKVCDFTNNITGKNQRTALGVSASGDTLFFVTVDGRKTDCPGFTQETLAELMIELGCYTAMNLDGGGSTTMVVEDKITGNQKVENNTTSLRSVSNALGVVSSLKSLSNPEGGKIAISADTILCDDNVTVSYGFYDKNCNRIPVDKATIKVTDKNAVIKNNNITFKTPGIHSVYVTYQDVTLSAQVQVLGDIFSISISPESADATDKNITFTATAYDRNGHSAPIPASMLEFVVSDSLAMSGNTISKTSASGTVCAKYKGLTANAVVNAEKYIRENDIKSHDDFYGKINIGKTLTLSGSIESPQNLIGILQNKKYIESIIVKSNLYCIGSVYDKWGYLTNYKTASAFSEEIIENSKIVTFSSKTSNSIRLTDSSNWSNIINICNNTKEKNIVFVTDSPFYNLDANEKIVWEYYMNILINQNKNVFVVSPGEKSEIKTENGVRYLYVGSVGNCSIESYNYGIEQSKPLTLSFLSDEIKYTFE